MVFTVRSSDLHGMSANDLENVAHGLAPAGNEREEMRVLEARVRRFEIDYEMSSAEMMRQVASGERKETADIARWRVLWSMLDDGRHVRR